MKIYSGNSGIELTVQELYELKTNECMDAVVELFATTHTFGEVLDLDGMYIDFDFDDMMSVQQIIEDEIEGTDYKVVNERFKKMLEDIFRKDDPENQ